jgi:hypothetical protein
MTFNPASTFCALNFFDNKSSPNTRLIEEKTISAIHLFPASFSCFHPSYPSFLTRKTSSLRREHHFDLADAFFLILITGSAFISSNKLKFLLLLSYALSACTLSISYFSAASLTNGPNFVVSCTFPFVILKETTFLDLYQRLYVI